MYISPAAADGHVEDDALKSSTRSLNGNSVSLFVETLLFVLLIGVLM